MCQLKRDLTINSATTFLTVTLTLNDFGDEQNGIIDQYVSFACICGPRKSEDIFARGMLFAFRQIRFWLKEDTVSGKRAPDDLSRSFAV